MKASNIELRRPAGREPLFAKIQQAKRARVDLFEVRLLILLTRPPPTNETRIDADTSAFRLK